MIVTVENWKNVINESCNNPHSRHPSVPSFFIRLPLVLSTGAAYVFRCTAGCTAANGVSNIFLSASPALSSLPGFTRFPVSLSFSLISLSRRLSVCLIDSRTSSRFSLVSLNVCHPVRPASMLCLTL